MEQRKSNKDAKGKTQEGQTPLRLNTEALFDGGLNRSSEEDFVMELERRVEVKLPFTTSVKERRICGESTKVIPITKRMAWGGYKKVKRNKGSVGIDHQSLEDYDEDLSDNWSCYNLSDS